MLVCEYCLQAIESHEGKQKHIVIYVDETNAEESRCEWCEESGNNALYDI